MTLARRLLRHTTRSNPQNPHDLQQRLVNKIHKTGLGPKTLQPPVGKRVHWNIDHLLDEDDVHLTSVMIIRSPENLEAQLANYLISQPETQPLAPGLGAHDHPGNTHILKVNAGRTWWEQLAGRLEEILPAFYPYGSN